MPFQQSSRNLQRFCGGPARLEGRVVLEMLLPKVRSMSLAGIQYFGRFTCASPICPSPCMERARRNSASQVNQSRRSKDGKNLYLLVTSTEKMPDISLVEPDDCRRFHVAIRDLSKQAAQQVLEEEEVGQFSDPDTAWIKISVIRKLAQGRVQPDWPQRFSDMLQYAERKGWLSEDRESASGHCEWIE